MLAEKNYIKKVVVEVDTSSMKQAISLKDNISTFLNDIFYTELDKILTEIEKDKGQNRYVKLSKIEATINLKNIADLEGIKEAISNQITEQILVKFHKQKDASKRVNKNQKKNVTKDAFTYFLETGNYPWWYKSESKSIENELENWLKNEKETEILKIQLNKSYGLDRIILSTENKLLIKLFIKFLGKTKLVISPDIASFSVLQNRTIRLAYFSALFHFSSHKDIEKLTDEFQGIPFYLRSKKAVFEFQKIVNFTTKLITENTFISEEKIVLFQKEMLAYFSIKKLVKKNKFTAPKIPSEENPSEDVSEPKNKETEFYISNAGLILLHPFLNSLFEKLQLIENGKIIKKDEAVHLLYYLATKTEQPYEHQLTFEKYLCAIPQNYPINRFVQLSALQKKECETLLKSVLQHWTALKSQNTDVLRNEFLLREGKLTLEKELEKLYIQRKAQDILLDKIPWTIGTAKLPWKKELIYTEW